MYVCASICSIVTLGRRENVLTEETMWRGRRDDEQEELHDPKNGSPRNTHPCGAQCELFPEEGSVNTVVPAV